MKVLMTGATGLVGGELGAALARKGHRLVIISRDRERALGNISFPCEVIEGDLAEAPVSSPLLEGVETVIHLMGEPLASGRWSAEKKDRLVRTRVQSTRHLRESLKGGIKVLVATSAIGFYGDRGDEVLSEEASPGSDFLARLCVGWEKEAFEFEKQGARVVCFRLGMVLSRRGGALAKLVPVIRAGLAGPLGGGGQWVGWVRIEDVVNLYVKALEQPGMRGVYNAVAPGILRNRDFMRGLARLLHRPAFFPVPGFVLKLLFGEMATILLASQRASSEKLSREGHEFLFPELSVPGSLKPTSSSSCAGP